MIGILRLAMKSGRHTYQISIEGRLDPDWAEWLDRVELRAQGTGTLITLREADEAAIYGAIRLLEGMRCALVGIRIVDDEAPREPARSGVPGEGEGGSSEN